MLVLSTTDKCLNDKVFRLKTKIENRLNYFEGAVMHSEKYTDQATLTKLSEIKLKYTSLINRLDKYKLYTNSKDYTEVYDVVKLWPDRKTHLFEEFGIEQSSNFKANPVLQKVFKQFEESAKQSSYACACDRLKLEIIDKRYRDWFIVFSTLTVDPQHYEEVFSKGSQVWRTYIRTIQRKVAKSCYGSYRKAKGKEYFSYFAVVEEGSKTQRLHIHVLMFMKDIFDCQDPNRGRRIPNRQEIKELNQYWKYGQIQAHIAVRFGGNDAYGKRNWRYPVDNDGNPIRVSTIGAVAGYLTKYIIKSKEVQVKGEITSWKIKVSKTLGKLRIQEALKTMNNRELIALIAPRKYPRPIMLHGQKVSSKTIRRLAVKESLQRDPSQEVLPKDTLIKTLCRSTIGKKHVRRSVSFGNILMRIMSNEVTFNIDDFYNASKTLKIAFSDLSAYTEVVGARLDEQR